MLGLLAAGWRYRQFISSSVQSEFAARYARSRLGALWMVVNLGRRRPSWPWGCPASCLRGGLG